MKYSLVLEKNAACCQATSKLLASMGYVTVPVFSPEKALQAAYVIKFDLVVTCTVDKPGDRRLLTSELRRFSPDTAMVLVVDEDADACGAASCAGVNSVLHRPVTARNLRSVVEFGLDGYGLQPAALAVAEERRRRPDRRLRGRERLMPVPEPERACAPDPSPSASRQDIKRA